MKRGSNIINTSSVTAYKGSAAMVDYSSTKGAITVRPLQNLHPFMLTFTC